MKKRLFALLLALAMLTGIMTACAAQTSETTETTATASTDENAGSYSITFIMPTRNEFNTTMATGMQAKCDELGINLTMQDVNNDSSKVIQFVESARNAGDKAVVVLPVDS